RDKSSRRSHESSTASAEARNSQFGYFEAGCRQHFARSGHWANSALVLYLGQYSRLAEASRHQNSRALPYTCYSRASSDTGCRGDCIVPKNGIPEKDSSPVSTRPEKKRKQRIRSNPHSSLLHRRSVAQSFL